MKKINLLIGTVAAAFISITGAALNRYEKLEARDAEVNIIAKDGYSNSDLLKDIRNEVNYNYRILKTYDSFFNGFKLSINENHIEDLKKAASVEAISHEHYYDVCEYYNGEGNYYGKYNNALADLNIPSNSKRGEGVLIAVLDSSFSTQHKSFTDLGNSINVKMSKSDFSSYVSNKDIHAKNARYFNNKVPFIYDYGGTQKYNNVKNAYGAQVEDNNPLGYSPHGMHVASLACANGEYIGVAPNAQLAVMKVFTDVTNSKNEAIGQTCYDSDIFEALGDAYIIGADVINLSLGSDLSDFKSEFNSTQHAIINKLNEKGVIVSVSAGNAGKGNSANKNGYKFSATDIVESGVIGSFASLEATTAVASSNISDDVDVSVYSSLSVNGKFLYGVDESVGSATPKETTFVSLIPNGKDSVDINYVMVPGLGELSDYNDINVSNKIAVVNRGTITFAQKIANAKSRGAVGIIICNAEGCGNLASFNLTSATADGIIPTFSGSYEEHEMLEKEENKVITITRELISNFSSEGAAADLSFRPKITAPGNEIYGAIASISSDKNEYSKMSGTSMASPNYAGSVACVLSDLKCDPKTLEARTLSTANVLKQVNGVSYSVRKQGAGLVDVKNAEQGIYLTHNDKGYIELKNNDDIKNGKLKFDVKIHNEKKLSGVYNCALEVTIPETSLIDSISYPDFKNQVVQTNKQQKICEFNFNINLDGNEEQIISVDYSLTDEQKSYIFSIYECGIELEGFLFLNSDTLPNLSIPFLGFIGDYDAVDCVEDFDFEKDENKLYQSDIAWSACQEFNEEVYDIRKANFGSCIAGNGMTLEEFNNSDIFDNYLVNKNDIQTLMNPIDGVLEDDGYYHIYAGVKGESSLIVIQQFVNRSIEKSDVTLTNEKGEVVLNDHMFDSLYGSDDELELYKSIITPDLENAENPYMLHRAYTILDLSSYSEGSYLLKFSYELTAGITQTREYILELGNESQTAKFSNVKIEDNILYVGFNKKINSLKINNEDATYYETVDNVRYYKYDISNLDFSKNISFKAEISTDEFIYGLFTKDGRALIVNNNLKDGYFAELKESIQENYNNTYSYEINVYDSNSNLVSLNGTTRVLLITDNETNGVFDYTDYQEITYSNSIEYIEYNGSIEFDLKNSLKFGVVYVGEEPDDPTDDDIFSKIINLLLNNVFVGAIILLFSFVLIIALIIILVVILRKKSRR